MAEISKNVLDKKDLKKPPRESTSCKSKVEQAISDDSCKSKGTRWDDSYAKVKEQDGIVTS